MRTQDPRGWWRSLRMDPSATTATGDPASATTITAVVGVYNAERFITATVESILAQTRPADEIIVIDDGSTDETPNLLAQFGGAVRVIRQDNGGCPAAFNRGFTEARGDYVAMCGADDLWLPTKLEQQAAALAEHPEIDIAFGASWSFGDADAPWPAPPGIGILDPGLFLPVLFAENIVCASSILVRRNLYQRLGPFLEVVDGERFACDDYEYWLRALTAGAVFYYGRGTHTRYRRHAGNATLAQGWVCRSRTATHELHAAAVTDRELVARTLANDLRLQARADVSEGNLASARMAFLRSLRHERNARALLFTALLCLPKPLSRGLIRRWERIRPALLSQCGPGPRLATFRRTLVDAGLAVQRAGAVGRLLPRRLRRAAGRQVRAWIGAYDAPRLLEDWSRPLICCGPAGHEAQRPLPQTALVRVAPDWRAAPDPSNADPDGGLRCLLATSDLDAGGTDEMVAFLACRLRQQGMQTAVLHTCRDEQGPLGRLGAMLTGSGIEVATLAEAAGRQFLDAWEPDVVSAHGASAWVLDAARSRGLPYVDVLHGMHPLLNLGDTAGSQWDSGVAAVIAVSDHVRREFLRRAPGFDADRAIVIPNGVDDDRRPRVDRAQARAELGLHDEFLFVSLARPCLQKNTYGLVAAFEDVAELHADAHLLSAGRSLDELYLAQLQRLRDRLPARGRVHLRDHAPNPAALLAAADGFVLDSFFEGWPLASMEALCAGVPVVISDVGGALEQVGTDGSRGYVVRNPLGSSERISWGAMQAASYAEQANRRELVAAMSDLIANRTHWAVLREQLAVESACRFERDRCVREHARILRSVVAQSHLASRATVG